MKHFLIIVFCCLLYMPLLAQEAFIYYEDLVMYPYDQYAYEFQSLVDHHVNSNKINHITDSLFLAFLDQKIQLSKRCTENDDCKDVTYKPSCMIQVVYVKDKCSYYTINLSSGQDIKESLTIDGKAYIPDEELQDVILEIVKYRFIRKRPVPSEELRAIINGKRMNVNESPHWPLIMLPTN